ncbi:hypothetical protein HaLaN_28473, partial [Haematococcus lacustris]
MQAAHVWSLSMVKFRRSTTRSSPLRGQTYPDQLEVHPNSTIRPSTRHLHDAYYNKPKLLCAAMCIYVLSECCALCYHYNTLPPTPCHPPCSVPCTALPPLADACSH